MVKRLLRDERGFTLVELMVVVVVIAILIAVAIPTFLGARERAQDRAAQSAAKNAVTGAMAIFTDRADFSPANQPTLQSGEPALTFVGPGASTNPDEISTATECVGACGAASGHNRFVAAVKSESGTCWFAQSVTTAGVMNPGVTWERQEDVDCEAVSAPVFDSTAAPDAWAKDPGTSVP